MFPWVHVVIGNLKRFLLGTHHHVGKNHLDGYITEYVYRLNRRFHEEDLFEHLLMACLLVTPKPKKQLKKKENSLSKIKDISKKQHLIHTDLNLVYLVIINNSLTFSNAFGA